MKEKEKKTRPIFTIKSKEEARKIAISFHMTMEDKEFVARVGIGRFTRGIATMVEIFKEMEKKGLIEIPEVTKGKVYLTKLKGFKNEDANKRIS